VLTLEADSVALHGSQSRAGSYIGKNSASEQVEVGSCVVGCMSLIRTIMRRILTDELLARTCNYKYG
jgi:hypothetical protein